MDENGDCHCTWYEFYVPNWACWIIHIVVFTLISLVFVHSIAFCGKMYFEYYDRRQLKLSKNNSVEPEKGHKRHTVMIFVEKNKEGKAHLEGHYLK